MDNLSMIDVNKPEKVQTALNELIAYKNSAGELATVTANSIGLGNVDNTSDADKPVSTAQKTYIDEADATLQANIDAEAETRASTDETLQTNIDALSESIASDLKNYYTKSETYSQDEVDAMVSAIPKYATAVVDELPTEDISESTVYLVVSGEESNNLYTEYIFVDDSWEKLGTQSLDLSGYATTEDLENAVENIDLSEYVKNTDYATNSTFGIVRADQINGIQASNGVLSIMGATDSQVNEKSSNGRPLQAKHIDKIVQLGITTNTNTLTEEEQASAQEWLGISGFATTEYVDELIGDISTALDTINGEEVE